MKCILVDDEPFALKILEDDLQKIEFLSVSATFSSANTAKKYLADHEADLMFLDIEMPGIRGTDFLRQLQSPPMTIFTTAYEQYALEGYELHVLDYLLKPIPFERLQKAVTKANELYQLRQDSKLKERSFFFVFSEYNKIKIFHDEVLYIEGLKDYVKIYTAQQPKYILTRLNLKNIESKLPLNGFCRVHQSFIVALNKIKSFQKSKIIISDKIIPIGETYLEKFENMINNSLIK